MAAESIFSTTGIVVCFCSRHGAPGPTATNRHWSVLAGAPRAGNGNQAGNNNGRASHTSGHAEVCAVGQEAVGRRERASGLPAPGVFALSPRASGYGERRTNGLARATECTSPTMWMERRRLRKAAGSERWRLVEGPGGELPGTAGPLSLSLSLPPTFSLYLPIPLSFRFPPI